METIDTSTRKRSLLQRVIDFYSISSPNYDSTTPKERFKLRPHKTAKTMNMFENPSSRFTMAVSNSPVAKRVIDFYSISSPNYDSTTPKERFNRIRLATFISATCGYALYYVCRLSPGRHHHHAHPP